MTDDEKFKEEFKRFQGMLAGASIRRGTVWKHLSPEILDWLLDETIKLRQPDIDIVIASLVRDAYHDDMEASE